MSHINLENLEILEILTDEQLEMLRSKVVDKIAKAIDDIDEKELIRVATDEAISLIRYNVMEDVDLTPIQEKLSTSLCNVLLKALGKMEVQE